MKEVSLSVYELKPGERVTMVAPSLLPTEKPRPGKEEVLSCFRAFIESNHSALKDLRGKKPEDQDNLFMDTKDEVVKLVQNLQGLRITEGEMSRQILACLGTRHKDEVDQIEDKDVARVTIEFLKSVREGIINTPAPKK